MADALIIVNQAGKPPGVAGVSREDLDLFSGANSVVLTNSDDVNVVSWAWTLLDRPAGSAAVLTTPTASSSTFNPDLRGTYLIQLVTVDNLGVSRTDKIGAAVQEVSGIRVPAAGETTEFDATRGWATEVGDQQLKDLAYKVVMGQSAADPAVPALAGALYVKDVAGNKELFFRSNAGIFQLTSGGSLFHSLQNAYDDGANVNVVAGTPVWLRAPAAGDQVLALGLATPSKTVVFFGDGDTVLGGSAMSATEKLRVVGDARVEGNVVLTGDSIAMAGGANGFITKSGTGPFNFRFNDGALVGLKLEPSATGGAIFSNDEPGAADGRPVFTFRATQNIPTGFSRILFQVEENNGAAAGDVRFMVTSEGRLRVRAASGSDPGIRVENNAAASLFAFELNNGFAQFSNLAASGIQLYNAISPGANPAVEVIQAVGTAGAGQPVFAARRDATNKIVQVDGDTLVTWTARTTTTGVEHQLYRDDGAAGAADEILGQVTGYGKDSANNKQQFTALQYVSEVVTDGSEIGRFDLRAWNLTQLARILKVRPDGGAAAAERGVVFINDVAAGASPAMIWRATADFAAGQKVFVWQDNAGTEILSVEGDGKLNVPGVIDPDGIIFDEVGADLTVAANKYGLYTKDVGGKSELFGRSEASAAVQLTQNGGLLNAAVVDGLHPNLSVKTHAAFTDSQARVLTNAITTTGTTIATLFELTIPLSTVWWFIFGIEGRESANAHRAVYSRAVRVSRTGAGVPTVGTPATILTDVSDGTWVLTVDQDGVDKFRVRVTGGTSQTIHWGITVLHQMIGGST